VDLRADTPLSHRAEIAPSLNLSFMLAGRTDLRFARRQYCFGTGGHGTHPPVPKMALFSTARPVEFSRQLEAGMRIRHLAIQASPDWLERNGLGSYGAVAPVLTSRAPLAISPRTPPEQVIYLSEQLFAATEPDFPLAKLYRESKVLEILFHALCSVSAAPAPERVNTRMRRSIYRVRDWLESESHRPLTLETLVREFGIGADTLQRQFRAVFGTTVFAYLHEHRMQRAWRSLENGDPVSVAAYAAGYTSPANFSTAFKRRFGVLPKQVRSGRLRPR